MLKICRERNDDSGRSSKISGHKAGKTSKAYYGTAKGHTLGPIITYRKNWNN